jgi:hypothetical protein
MLQQIQKKANLKQADFFNLFYGFNYRIPSHYRIYNVVHKLFITAPRRMAS